MKATVSLAIAVGILLILIAFLAPMELPSKIFAGLIGAVFAIAGAFNRHR